MDEPVFCQRCGTRLELRPVEDRVRPVCPSCGFVHYVDPKLAVAVVLPYNGGVLLGRRAIDPGRGRWSFPSGYVNRGEVVEEAALREVEEELGVRARLLGLVGLYSERGRAVVLAVYAGEVVSGEPAPGDELEEVGVFPPDALPEMAFCHDEQIVADWRAFLERLR